MAFSVFTQPVFLFSDSRKQLLWTKSPWPGELGGGSRGPRAEARPGQGLLPAGRTAPGQQLWSVGLAPAHLLARVAWGWDGRIGLYEWFSIQMTKKPTVRTVKTPRCQAYKNLCHRVDLIQDFSSCPSVEDRFCCNFI